jgi:hypothetical protein
LFRFILFTIGLILCLIILFWYLTKPWVRGSSTFPGTELVFQVDALDLLENYNENNLGFVNADGSGETYLTITNRLSYLLRESGASPTLPVITTDDSTLAYRIKIYPGHPGELVILEAGHAPIKCSTRGNERPSLTSHPNQIMIDTVDLGWQAHVLYKLSSCRKGLEAGIIEVYDQDSIGYNPSHGALSPDKRFLAYGRDFAYFKQHHEVDPYKLFVYDLENNTELLVGSGEYPTWSPDGEWLAYTGRDDIGLVGYDRIFERHDGIYVARPDGTEKRKVVEISPLYTEWDSLPSWSPDGKWLTYHKCILPDDPGNLCKERYHFAIFILNVETGEETKIVDGGLNPFWRWRDNTP